MQITWPMSSEFKKSKATIAGMAHFSYIFTISIQSHMVIKKQARLLED